MPYVGIYYICMYVGTYVLNRVDVFLASIHWRLTIFYGFSTMAQFSNCGIPMGDGAVGRPAACLAYSLGTPTHALFIASRESRPQDLIALEKKRNIMSMLVYNKWVLAALGHPLRRKIGQSDCRPVTQPRWILLPGTEKSLVPEHQARPSFSGPQTRPTRHSG